MSNEINLLLAQNENFRFVKCEFPRGQQLYTYKTVSPVKEGDYVVVETPSTGFQVVKVVQVCKLHEVNLSSAYSYKWVVQVVDDSNYKELLEKEQTAIKLLNDSKTKKLVNDMTAELELQLGIDGVSQLTKLTRL
jgi:hypothetical protein